VRCNSLLLLAVFMGALAGADAKKRPFTRPGTKPAEPEKKEEETVPMFELPTSHYDDYENVMELDEDVRDL
jgi:hypothetical protein